MHLYLSSGNTKVDICIDTSILLVFTLGSEQIEISTSCNGMCSIADHTRRVMSVETTSAKLQDVATTACLLWLVDLQPNEYALIPPSTTVCSIRQEQIRILVSDWVMCAYPYDSVHIEHSELNRSKKLPYTFRGEINELGSTLVQQFATMPPDGILLVDLSTIASVHDASYFRNTSVASFVQSIYSLDCKSIFVFATSLQAELFISDLTAYVEEPCNILSYAVMSKVPGLFPLDGPMGVYFSQPTSFPSYDGVNSIVTDPVQMLSLDAANTVLQQLGCSVTAYSSYLVAYLRPINCSMLQKHGILGSCHMHTYASICDTLSTLIRYRFVTMTTDAAIIAVVNRRVQRTFYIKFEFTDETSQLIYNIVHFVLAMSTVCRGTNITSCGLTSFPHYNMHTGTFGVVCDDTHYCVCASQPGPELIMPLLDEQTDRRTIDAYLTVCDSSCAGFQSVASVSTIDMPASIFDNFPITKEIECEDRTVCKPNDSSENLAPSFDIMAQTALFSRLQHDLMVARLPPEAHDIYVRATRNVYGEHRHGAEWTDAASRLPADHVEHDDDDAISHCGSDGTMGNEEAEETFAANCTEVVPEVGEMAIDTQTDIVQAPGLSISHDSNNDAGQADCHVLREQTKHMSDDECGNVDADDEPHFLHTLATDMRTKNVACVEGGSDVNAQCSKMVDCKRPNRHRGPCSNKGPCSKKDQPAFKQIARKRKRSKIRFGPLHRKQKKELVCYPKVILKLSDNLNKHRTDHATLLEAATTWTELHCEDISDSDSDSDLDTSTSHLDDVDWCAISEPRCNFWKSANVYFGSRNMDDIPTMKEVTSAFPFHTELAHDASAQVFFAACKASFLRLVAFNSDNVGTREISTEMFQRLRNTENELDRQELQLFVEYCNGSRQTTYSLIMSPLVENGYTLAGLTCLDVHYSARTDPLQRAVVFKHSKLSTKTKTDILLIQVESLHAWGKLNPHLTERCDRYSANIISFVELLGFASLRADEEGLHQVCLVWPVEDKVDTDKVNNFCAYVTKMLFMLFDNVSLIDNDSKKHANKVRKLFFKPNPPPPRLYLHCFTKQSHLLNRDVIGDQLTLSMSKNTQTNTWKLDCSAASGSTVLLGQDTEHPSCHVQSRPLFMVMLEARIKLNMFRFCDMMQDDNVAGVLADLTKFATETVWNVQKFLPLGIASRRMFAQGVQDNDGSSVNIDHTLLGVFKDIQAVELDSLHLVDEIRKLVKALASEMAGLICTFDDKTEKSDIDAIYDALAKSNI